MERQKYLGAFWLGQRASAALAVARCRRDIRFAKGNRTVRVLIHRPATASQPARTNGHSGDAEEGQQARERLAQNPTKHVRVLQNKDRKVLRISAYKLAYLRFAKVFRAAGGFTLSSTQANRRAQRSRSPVKGLNGARQRYQRGRGGERAAPDAAFSLCSSSVPSAREGRYLALDEQGRMYVGLG